MFKFNFFSSLFEVRWDLEKIKNKSETFFRYKIPLKNFLNELAADATVTLLALAGHR